MSLMTRPQKKGHINPWPSLLKRIRKERGLTIEQAAAKVGVTPRAWKSWEQPSQNRRPSKSHAILISLVRRGDL